MVASRLAQSLPRQRPSESHLDGLPVVRFPGAKSIMFKSQGKELDEIGGPGFSRVRRFDDEARKARIFNPKAATSVDVDALENLVHEKKTRKEIEDENRKKFEYTQAYQLHKWNESDEKLRQDMIEQRRELEETWRRQDEDFKERWKKQYHVFNAHDPVSIVPMSRYRQQDEEPIVDAQRKSEVYDVVSRQVQETRARKQQDLDDYWAYEYARMGALARLKRCEEELENKLKQDHVSLSEEHLQAARNKLEREKRFHQDEHNYQIHHSFFDQFGTTSR